MAVTRPPKKPPVPGPVGPGSDGPVIPGPGPALPGPDGPVIPGPDPARPGPVRPDPARPGPEQPGVPVPHPPLDPIPPQPPPPSPWQLAQLELSGHEPLPIALLPVRIETRFTASDLLVRVYPDGLHADALKRPLSQEEKDAGKSFWDVSKTPPGKEQEAWSMLVDAVGGPWRAAWVIRQTKKDGAEVSDAEPGIVLRLLPRRWVVVGTLAGEEVIRAAGQPITGTLAGLPSLDSSGDWLSQAEVKWMIDFDAAVARGMALRIPLTGRAKDVITRGLDTLVVFGVAAADGQAAGTALEDLLVAQHYTKGAGFLAQGEATNRAQGNAALLRPPPKLILSHEKNPQPTRNLGDFNGANAVALMRAFGLADSVLRRLVGSQHDEQALAKAMNTLVWPVTWGTLLWGLRNSGGGPLLPAEDIKTIRAHFVQFVRGPGPLPTLRVGATPYGILPVCPLPLPDGADVHGRMRGVLQHLLGRWSEAAATLSIVDTGADDSPADAPAEDRFAQLLAGQPWPTRYAVRKLKDVPALVAAASGTVTHKAMAAYVKRLAAITAAGIAAARIPLHRNSFRPTLSEYEDEVVDWGAPIAEGSEAVQGPVSVRPQGGGSLLDQIVNHGRALLADARYSSAAQRKIETDEFEEAVTVLGAAPDRARILGQSLSLAATRLDAWITSIATRQLSRLREKKRSGVLVGAWGVVHDLRPAAKNAATAGYALTPSLAHAAVAAALRSGQAAYSAAGSSPYDVDLSSERVRDARWLFNGIRQGQSLASLLGQRYERILHDYGADALIQATRLAVLTALGRANEPPHAIVDGLLVARALTPADNPARDERTADEIGVAEALMTAEGPLHKFGQRVKERLETLVKADPVLKSKAAKDLTPADVERLRAKAEREFARTLEQIAAAARRRQSSQPLHAALGVDTLALLALDPVIRAADALADTALFEAAFRLFNGEHEAAGATLAAVDRGDAAPPELRSLDTPRDGIVMTHRVLLLMPQEVNVALGWARDPSAAAIAEPRLERWAVQMLGGIDRIRLVITAYDPSTGELRASKRHKLSQISGIGALEFCRLAAQGPLSGGPLEARLRIERTVATLDSGDRLEIEDDDELADGDISLSEAHALAASVARVWRVGRPAGAKDLESPGSEKSVPSRQLVDEFGGEKGRVALLRAEFGRLHGTCPARPEQADRKALLTFLGALSKFGARCATPPADFVTRPTDELRPLVLALKAALAEAMVGPKGPNGELASIELEQEWIYRVVGDDYPLLPLYAPKQSPAPSPLGEAAGTREISISTWLGQLARVRPNIEALHTALQVAEARMENPRCVLYAGQTGGPPGEAWPAVRRPADDEPRHCVTAAFLRVREATLEGALAGLVIDAWSERVPAREQVGGVALHWQGPAAQAPQVILLAVPPEEAAHWSLAELQAAVTSAFTLARIRGVSSSQLEGLGHLLPCIFMDGKRIPVKPGGVRQLDRDTLTRLTR